ncbi:MAG: aspartyl/asparaginyl beta-hydroxylase domain-containing protein [Isosphaeraceae bacterium]
MILDHINYEALLVPVNKVFNLRAGGRRRPVFHEIDATCPQLRELDRNYPVIREELEALLARRQSIPRYHELDRMQTNISAKVDPDKDWKVFYLDAMGEKPQANRDLCPHTSALLDQVPGLFQAFFSILDGGKSIPAHEGPYLGYIRYHLGLIVPEESPPSIRIKDQHYTWQEGQSVLFDDSWEHEVTNACPARRVVLIVDIRRPMPLPLDALNRFVVSIMRLVYGKDILKKLA